MVTVRTTLFFLQLAVFQAAVLRSQNEIRKDPAAKDPPDRGGSGSMDATTEDSTAKISGSVQTYQGPLPKLPGTMDKPWVTLHSPVKMYIPIRYTDGSSAESPECVLCPRNWTVYLRPRQRHILSPVPTLSICPRLAQRPGRVHVAVVSGPRPGQLLFMGRYPVELVLWKADGPVHSCTYTVTVKGRRRPGTPPPPPSKRKSLPCVKPDPPPGGALACDPGGEDRPRLPHGGVCQFFCLPHHSIENSTDSSMTVVCQDGQWSPHNRMICVAITCPIPAPPLRGVWNCDSEFKESNKSHVGGTRCMIRCEEGHVVPTSQLHGATLVCNPPSWNDSTTSRCKKAHLPKILRCHDRHVIVREGHQVPVTDKLLPRGAGNGGVLLEPTCSLRKGWSLSGGEYRNECEVTDFELRTRKKCSYSVRVEESSGPRPHPDDCRNKTLIVDPGGTGSVNTVRFLVSVGQPSRTKELIAQCSSQGPLAVGMHLIRCAATDSDTGATDTCSFWVTVKEKSCPELKPIPNGHVICPSRGVGSRCHYECAQGFSTRVHPPEKTCRPNLEWHPDDIVVCEIQPPVLVSGCENLTLTKTQPLNVSVHLPTFFTSLNQTVTVSCQPEFLTESGQQRVRCEAGVSSCSFVVTILLEDEDETASPTNIFDSTISLRDEDETASRTDVLNITIPLEDIKTTTSPTDVLNITIPLEDTETTTSPTDVLNITIPLEDTETTASPTDVLNITIPVMDTETVASPTDILGITISLMDTETTASPTDVLVITIPLVDTKTTASPTKSVKATFLPKDGEETASLTGIVNTTILLEDEETTASLIDVVSITNGDSCESLQAPVHGSLECFTENGIEECHVTCDPGHDFPNGQPLTVRCEDGYWDFQESDIKTTLPDCLAQMEGTAVEIWMGFEALALHCDEDLEDQIRAIVEEKSLCPPVTRCDTSVNCTLDEENDTMLVSVNWTVQADFDWEEDQEIGEDVPEAETRLEAALERARALIAFGDIPGLQLFRDSFRRGLISLVCPEGFKADMMAAKCVECCADEGCYGCAVFDMKLNFERG